MDPFRKNLEPKSRMLKLIPAVFASTLVIPAFAESVEFNIEFESDPLVTVGEATLTHTEFDAYMTRVAPGHRPMFLADPNRLSEAIENLVLARQLAMEAKTDAQEIGRAHV